MQLHELHPSLVHLPIGLLPASLAADAVGRARGHAGLADAGRIGIMLTAGSAIVAATTGLIAQEEVAVDGAHDLLATHRTLNIGVVGLSVAMAIHRAGRDRAGGGYLATGLLALGITTYSAYLGGQMVYGHGVGVEPAGGLAPDHAPPIGVGSLGTLLRRAGRDVRLGLKHTLKHLREGRAIPALPHADPASGSQD